MTKIEINAGNLEPKIEKLVLGLFKRTNKNLKKMVLRVKENELDFRVRK